MEKKSITLNLDGKKNITRTLNRTYPGPELDNDGIIFLSRQILSDEVWEVSVFVKDICSNTALKQH